MTESRTPCQVVLALETSGVSHGVALASGGRVAAREAERDAVAGAVAALLRERALRPRDVTAVVLTVGPGRFTSLRVGAATALAFVAATGARLAGVSTLALLASAHEAERVVAVLDAGRGRYWARGFAGLDPVGAPALATREELLAQHGSDAVFVGDVGGFPHGVPAKPTARGLLALYARAPEAFAALDPEGFEPTYLRAPAQGGG